MRARSDYQFLSAGEWRMATLPGIWNREIEEKVLSLVNRQPWAKHPQTLSLRFPEGGKDQEYYLKVIHGVKGGGAFKDAVRISKAFRAWQNGIALAEAGFNVPLTIAAGEQRFLRLLQRAFILSQKIDGQPAHLFLRDMLDRRDKEILAAKRTGLKRAANLIRRFHKTGFVHGDLVASNIFVSNEASGEHAFYFMDNDRTRRYPSWLPQSLWKRNLIQLNRLPLPGITLQDRMRFFQAYLNRQELTKADRRLIRWLERKTRRRRQECDGIDASGDFRRLMRWSRDLPGPTDAERF
jgi:lipopolysaccharide kinase (Kdo/WaaP) family protein